MGCVFWLSDKTVRKFAELRVYTILSVAKKCIAGTLVSGDTFCAVILWVSLNRERETGELCSQLSHMLFTDV